jgi:hypothetical protein
MSLIGVPRPDSRVRERDTLPPQRERALQPQDPAQRFGAVPEGGQAATVQLAFAQVELVRRGGDGVARVQRLDDLP